MLDKAKEKNEKKGNEIFPKKQKNGVFGVVVKKKCFFVKMALFRK